MINKSLFLVVLTVSAGAIGAQTPSPTPPPAAPNVQSRQAAAFDLTEYGVQIQADTRLIIVMAALEAAGFDPTPAGRELATFRAIVRKDLANLDPGLRERLRNFFERSKLPPPATPADQAARYVSLAYALGPPPLLESPQRSDDLPTGVLEVLDFAPLLQEFYKKSGLDEKLLSYARAAQAEGDRLRPPTAEMVRAVLSYLHTRPITFTNERVKVKSPDKKKNPTTTYTTVRRERRFFIIPDLLAAPGTINFRVIGDDYFAIVPEGIDPTSSELRRAYLQYVIDALVLRNNKETAARREQIKQLIDARVKEGGEVSTDVFLVVSRSLVSAADIDFEQSMRLANVTSIQRRRLQEARDDAARAIVARDAQAARAAIADEATTRLAEEYEKGSVLAFYFAEKLHDVEVSGFDVANFFADMIAGFDPARESKRLGEITEARNRALAARKAHPRYAAWLVDPSAEATDAAFAARNLTLVKNLSEVEKLWQLRSYEEAEKKLKAMLQESPGDARLLFALGRTASLWARDTTDDQLQSERLNRALANYGFAVQAASPETDRALLSRAHEAMGRILAFLEHNDEAMKEFEAAIKIGDVAGGAYRDAMEGKRKLSQP